MKKLAAVIALALALTLSTGVYAAGKGGLVVLGDSISTGYGLQGGLYECDSYGNLLAAYLGYSNEDGTYVDAADNGDTSRDMLEVIETMTDKISAASVIAFSIGGNDVLMPMLLAVIDTTGIPESAGLQGAVAVLTNKSGVVDIEAVYASVAERLSDETLLAEFDEKIANYKSNYEAIAKRLRELNPDALIVAQTLFDPTDGFDALKPASAFIGRVLGGMNAVTSEVSAAHDIAVADVGADFADRGVELTNISSFDIHPSAEGHRHIFELIKKIADDAGVAAADETDAAEAVDAPAAAVIGSDAPATAGEKADAASQSADVSAQPDNASANEPAPTDDKNDDETTSVDDASADDTKPYAAVIAVCAAAAAAVAILIPILINKKRGR